MPATNVETLTNPRDSLPNAYTNVNAREIDFVNRFSNNWAALQNIIGVSRPIRKAPGSRLVSYTADVALESGAVGAGSGNCAAHPSPMDIVSMFPEGTGRLNR